LKSITLFSILVLLSNAVSAIELNCIGNNCIQIARNYGTVTIDGKTLQIGINRGVIKIVGDPKDTVKIKNYAVKVECGRARSIFPAGENPVPAR